MTLLKRLDRLEAAQGGELDVAEILVAHRYQPPRTYNRAQLLDLAQRDDLAGRVARGLMRINRCSTAAPVLDPFDAERELAAIMASFYADPLSFAYFAFEWGSTSALSMIPAGDEITLLFDVTHGLDAWQNDLLRDIGAEVAKRPFDRKAAVPAVRVATASGHGIGKTMLQSILLCWLMSTRDHVRGVATSPTAAQLGTRLWPEVHTWLRRCVTATWFDVATAKGAQKVFHKQHPTTWRFDFQTCAAENSESFAGLHNATSTVAFLVDEMSGLDQRVLNAIEGSMTDGAPIVCGFGNPLRRTGPFADIFSKQGDRWLLRHVDSRSAYLTNKEQLRQWIEYWGEDSDWARARIRGLFPNADAAAFFSPELVKLAATRPVPAMTTKAVAVIGVDVARALHGDASVIATRIGTDARTFPMQLLQGADGPQLAQRVAMHANFLRASGYSKVIIVIDAAGVGVSPLDSLRRLGFEPIAAQAAGQSSNPRETANCRAEWTMRAHRRMSAGELLIEDNTELHEELQAVGLLFDKTNRILVEAKDQLRARLGRSPDRMDALFLTMAVEDHLVQGPVDPWERDLAKLQAKRRTWGDYNPIEHMEWEFHR